MATPTDTHAEPVNTETPSQGIFMGYLALGLLVFARRGRRFRDLRRRQPRLQLSR